MPWTGLWKLQYLRPTNIQLVRNRLLKNWSLHEMRFGTKRDNFVGLLESKDNFAVNATSDNPKKVDFYIICCIRGIYMLKQAFTCVWGTSFRVRDTLMSNKYYQKWKRNDSSLYILLKDSQVVFKHIEYMNCVKFLIKPTYNRMLGSCPI